MVSANPGNDAHASSSPSPGALAGLTPPLPSVWKTRWVSFLLIAADFLGFSACWLGAYGLRWLASPFAGPINPLAPYLKLHLLITGIAILNGMAFGLYLHRRRLASLNQPRMLITASYHWLLYIVVVGFFFKELDLGRSVIILAGLLGFVWLCLSRGILKKLKTQAIREGRGKVRSVILGSEAQAREVRDALLNHPEVGFEIIGRIRPSQGPEEDIARASDLPVLGSLGDFHHVVEQAQVEEVFVAVAHLDAHEQLAVLNVADRRGLSVHVVSDVFGVLTQQAKVDEIGTFPVITLRDGYMPITERALKRLLDVICAAIGVVLWLLLFHWWIAWRIRRESPGPVFFVHGRVGCDGEVFQIYKYRTMRTDAEPYAVAPTEDQDPRITPFGRWLRRTSLDELPQLLNVLRGEMSMVGPRPEMPFIVDTYEPWQRRRLDVKPGLTGLWQVVGRKNLPLHLNMQYDFYYIKNQSFLLDLEILLRTIPAVLKGRGAF